MSAHVTHITYLVYFTNTVSYRACACFIVSSRALYTLQPALTVSVKLSKFYESTSLLMFRDDKSRNRKFFISRAPRPTKHRS